MADDEQFSLCWNNFNSNLSAGFHESLCRGDLVDVTLAAEGQFVKAHRLVLSVCSPYFRKMFTQMPANQHAFVFLKDVSHTALKDLIQFMYCGEVNVKQEALPAFISTAEALQIKGLTDSDPPQSQTPPEPSTPTPPQIQQIATSPRVRQRTSTSRSYKIETVDDSGEEQKQQPTQIVIQTTAAPPQATIVHHAPQQQQQQHHIQTAQATQQQQIVTAAPTTTTTTVLTQKRPAQRSIGSSAPHIKRTKSTIETIVDTSNEAAQQNVQVQQQPQQITVQAAVVTTDKSGHQQAETEYIDLPIDLPTKSEPEYADEAGDVEGDHEGTYVEDDAYADIRYDESYFTENEDGGNNVSSGTTTVSTGGGNSTATTSKAVIKQQQSSFSDSTYVDGGAGDQGNNDAQAKKAVKRGRPRKIKGPVMKPRDKLLAAIENNDGKPVVYASTIKGSMKLYYDGHHFNYFFRKGQHSIFQCCYKESKQQCPVKVVCDQKLVYPLEGEHIHFMKATDKSVTSVKFECAEFASLLIDDNERGLIANATKAAEENANNTKIEPIDAGDDIGQEVVIELEDEGAKSVEVVREALEETAETDAAEDNEDEEFLRDDDVSDVGGVENFQEEVASASGGSTKTEAKDFREQIKKRLQSALLRKMK